MQENNCLFCRYSRFIEVDRFEGKGDFSDKLDCDIHGIGPQDRAGDCGSYEENPVGE